MAPEMPRGQRAPEGRDDNQRFIQSVRQGLHLDKRGFLVPAADVLGHVAQLLEAVVVMATGRGSSPVLHGLCGFKQMSGSGMGAISTACRLSGDRLQLLKNVEAGIVKPLHLTRLRFVARGECRHLFHRLMDVRMNPCCDAAKDCSAQKDRFLGRSCRDFHTRGVRQKLPDYVAATRAAADHYAVDRSPGRSLRLDDLAQSIANPAKTRDIKCDQTVEIAFHAQPCDDSAGMWIGMRCAVAKELWDNVNVSCQNSRIGTVAQTHLSARSKPGRQ